MSNLGDFESQSNEFYEQKYSEFMSTGLIGKYWGYIHKLMEKPYINDNYTRILEVGSGNGEHFIYVRCKYKEYYLTDIRIENLKKSVIENDSLVIEKADVEKLQYPDNYFDRVIVTCVLSHLVKPYEALSELFRVTKKGGQISIYMPCEPGLFLRLVRKYTTRKKAKKLGIDEIAHIHFLEHRNYFLAVDFFIRMHATKNMSRLKAKYHPLFIKSWNLNLFTIYQIKK